MRVNINAPPTGITGIGVSEVTAALEHELSQGGVPRRNGDQTAKFKNINDLANEIMLNQSKNISSIQFYQQ
jgi:hypothetical protein